VAALMGEAAHGQAAAQLEKEQAIKRAEVAIYSEVSRWVGSEIPPGEPVPIVRHGRRVGQLPATLWGNPAQKVAEAVRIEGKGEIRRKKRKYSKVCKACQDTLHALLDGNMMDRTDLEVSADTYIRKEDWEGRATLKARIIKEIGFTDAATISLIAIREAASTEIHRLETKLEALNLGKRGAPRNEAAYAVALELARLYAKVTGRKPTYAEGPDGLSGEYTPSLRIVFDALGLKVGLRGPATAARDAVTDEDMKYEANGLFGILSAMSGQ
jgi:hypothetical protein